jgi:N-acetylglucosaminyldiphosphoundecaprenol N-acetyl-beta-D-mannosaminyltransferase
MRYNEASNVAYMDVKISNVDYHDILKNIRMVANNQQRGYFCLTDVGNVISCTKDELLKRAINESILSIADGMPLVWFARLVGCTKIERISGVDLMKRLFAEKDGTKHYLLGDTDQILNEVIKEALIINPTISITGHSPPFRDFSDDDNNHMIHKIRETDPDIIWVAFGGGKQEKWMRQNINKLEKGIMIGVGSGFRWLTGDIKAPPKIFQKIGLQWLSRMLQGLAKDPKKGFRFLMERQVKKFPVFIVNFPFEVINCRKKNRSVLKQK